MSRELEFYKPFPSKSKNKKYSVRVMKNGKPKLLHFGDSRHFHFRDTTGVGAWSHLDNNDPERRRLYFARHGFTNDETTPKYWSNRFLWSQ
jgi:hypothetical protein